MNNLIEKGYCPVCCKREAPIRVGYVGCKCDGCGYYFSDALHFTVMNRRLLLKLSKKELAEKLNIKLSTVSHYEKNWPSKRYWEATKELVLAETMKGDHAQEAITD